MLGFVGLLLVPALALRWTFTHYLARVPAPEREPKIKQLRAASLLATETFTWAWAVISCGAILLFLPILGLPRLSLHLFALLAVLAGLGGVISASVCAASGILLFWGWLLAVASGTRVLLGGWCTSQEPWSEAALAAIVAAGFFTVAPALRQKPVEVRLRLAACRIALDRDFLLWLGATFSVLLAAFLFSSADRIVAQRWFGFATNNNMGVVDWSTFDAYQTAGLLARAILWGTQPLLGIMFVQRARLAKSTAGSLRFYWAHLVALFAGAIAVLLSAQPLSRLFCGTHWEATAHFVPSLAVAMVPLGMLQGLGFFALASRRLPECFVLGACGVGYALLLFFVGRQPQLMPSYMFGAGLVSLMIVLFVGVVRWGRQQP